MRHHSARWRWWTNEVRALLRSAYFETFSGKITMKSHDHNVRATADGYELIDDQGNAL